MSTEVNNANKQSVLCVDLDGTLINSDLLIESVLALLKLNIFYLFLIPLWFLKGKAHLKHKIANKVTLEVALLPYNESLLSYLKEERQRGTCLVLCTASNELYAHAVAKHLEIFDEVFSSTASCNLKGANKAKLLVEKYGSQSFDYAGDSRSDYAVWDCANDALVVSSQKGFIERVGKKYSVAKTFAVPSRSIDYLRMLRIHQWVKNLLIFLPLLMAHKVINIALLLDAVTAFFAFCFCASSVYIINDLADLDADRAHATKCKRPFASGAVPLSVAFLAVPLLLTTSALLASLLPRFFSLVLGLYFFITFCYSLYFKRVAIFDIILLASLYTIRVLAGGAAVAILVSHWLLAFSMFMFFSLACVKRFSELASLRATNGEFAKGRGYKVSDLEQIGSFGTASGYIAILVMALYVNSQAVSALYSVPEILWLLCPPLLYWISRVWIIAGRGSMHEDPIVFALRDHISYFVGIICIIIIWLAI